MSNVAAFGNVQEGNDLDLPSQLLRDDRQGAIRKVLFIVEGVRNDDYPISTGRVYIQRVRQGTQLRYPVVVGEEDCYRLSGPRIRGLRQARASAQLFFFRCLRLTRVPMRRSEGWLVPTPSRRTTARRNPPKATDNRFDLGEECKRCLRGVDFVW